MKLAYCFLFGKNDSHVMVSVWGAPGWLPPMWGSGCSSQGSLSIQEFLCFYPLGRG